MPEIALRKAREIIKIVYKNKPKKHHNLYDKLMVDNKKTCGKLTKNAKNFKQPSQNNSKENTTTHCFITNKSINLVFSILPDNALISKYHLRYHPLEITFLTACFDFLLLLLIYFGVVHVWNYCAYCGTAVAGNCSV
ncbi:TPA: hypothetical protein I8Y22_000080 [Raoultella planticola]|nr:hypothetical protein [Raoultella planticola]